MREKERVSYFAWLDLPLHERNPRSKTRMAQLLKVSTPTLRKWEREREAGDKEYNSKDFFISRKKELDAWILKGAERNYNYAKLAKQLAGELIEKSEITHRLTADEIDRLTKQAEDEHRAGVLRISEVSSEPALLPE